MTISFLLLILLVSATFLLSSYSVYCTFNQRKREWIYNTSFREEMKQSRLPLVKFTIAGKPCYFVIDSGSTNNVLNKEYFDSVPLDAYHYVSKSDHSVIGLGSKDSKAEETIKVGLSLSDKSGKYDITEFIVADINAPISSIAKTVTFDVAGILGVSFLKRYGWVLDFNNQIIWHNLNNR